MQREPEISNTPVGSIRGLPNCNVDVFGTCVGEELGRRVCLKNLLLSTGTNAGNSNCCDENVLDKLVVYVNLEDAFLRVLLIHNQHVKCQRN